MSTIQQDMTDAAAVWERLAKRLAEAHGDDSEEMWDQATQIHAAATIMHGFADKHKAKLHAAVDEDAPRDAPCLSFVCNMCVQGLFEGPCSHRESQKHCHAYNPAR